MVDVLPASQDRVEPGAQLDQRTDAAVHLDTALVGLDQAVEYFQQGAFAGAVAADLPPRSPAAAGRSRARHAVALAEADELGVGVGHKF